MPIYQDLLIGTRVRQFGAVCYQSATQLELPHLVMHSGQVYSLNVLFRGLIIHIFTHILDDL